MDFKKKTRPQILEKKKKKKREKNILKNLYAFFEGRERGLDIFESKIFSIKIEGTDFS